MRLTLASLLLVLLLGAWLTTGAQGVGSNRLADPNAAISIEIRAERESVKAGDPIKIRITEKNVSDHSLRTWWANEGWTYPIYLVEDTGSSKTEPRISREIHRHVLDPGNPKAEINDSDAWARRDPGEGFTLPAGQSITYIVDAGKICDLSKPGQCTIHVERFDEASGVTVKSKSITVDVEPL